VTAYNIVNAPSLVAGQPEDISVVLANLQAIAAVVNGNLDDTNLNAAAAIAASKLAGYPTDPLKVLRGDGSWGTPPASMSYGTALPGSPADGREHVLVDSLTAPTYMWHLRYNAGATGPNKWEFIGGTDLLLLNTTAEAITSGAGAWGDTATVGPTFTAPRAGAYKAVAECLFLNNAAAAQAYVQMGLGYNAGWSTPFFQLLTNFPATTGVYQSVSGSTIANLTAGQVLQARYFRQAATAVTVQSRVLRISPVALA